MATLEADLTSKLDASSLIASHFGSGGSGGAIATPLSSLQGVSLPVDISQLTSIANGATSFDQNGISVAVNGVLQNAGSLVASIPGAGNFLAPIEQAVALVESATSDSLTANLSAVVTRLRSELEAPRDAGFVDTL